MLVVLTGMREWSARHPIVTRRHREWSAGTRGRLVRERALHVYGDAVVALEASRRAVLGVPDAAIRSTLADSRDHPSDGSHGSPVTGEAPRSRGTHLLH
jgi:hypothetical protein